MQIPRGDIAPYVQREFGGNFDVLLFSICAECERALVQNTSGKSKVKFWMKVTKKNTQNAKKKKMQILKI